MRVTAVACYFLALIHLGIGSYCTEPFSRGRCNDRLTRYGYNGVKNECMPFVYHGCDGNANNFHSKSSCEAKCKL